MCKLVYFHLTNGGQNKGFITTINEDSSTLCMSNQYDITAL